jgi:phosphinothricin acetyltransferase
MPVRPATPDDAAPVADIYNYYIANSHATFELDAIDGQEMLRRMEDGWKVGYPFLVYEDGGEVLGYAYGRQFRPRRAYLHSIEVSVYIRNGSEGRSIGTLLYEQLFAEIEQGDFHAIIGGISLPNDASVRLHEKFGFEKVAQFREVGFKFGRWIDVGYWERILD